MLAEIGAGGFGAQDLELIQQLGALSWVRADCTALYCTVKCISKAALLTSQVMLIVPPPMPYEWLSVARTHACASAATSTQHCLGNGG